MRQSPLKDTDKATKKLEDQLCSELKGEVRFDSTSRALYATDASNYRQPPIGVVVPRNTSDVIKAVQICRKYNVPVLPRGAGTSLCGQTCNTAVVFDFSKYLNKIVELDPTTKTAYVEPGVVLDDLRDATEKHDLTFAPDPSTHNHNTLGGMIGNNSCGPHSVMAGRTSDNLLELDILTYEGHRMTVGATTEIELQEILRKNDDKSKIFKKLLDIRNEFAEHIRKSTPDIPRLVSGFNLYELLPEHGFNVARALTGSEGTCCLILGAKLKLVESPQKRVLLALGFESIFSAADYVPEVMKHNPIATEGVDNKLVSEMQAYKTYLESVEMLPEGEGWLLVEFGANTVELAERQAKRLMEELEHAQIPHSSRLFSHPKREEKIWIVRRSALGVTAHPPQKDITWEGWEDSAVEPAKLGEYLRSLQALYDEFNYQGDFYGHFGQGCVHTRVNFDLRTAKGINHYKDFMQRASDLVIKFGGSLSGEHGDGQSKAQFLDKMYGPDMVKAFQAFKTAWDPDWKMNPGKVVQPYSIDENLRLGSNYNPEQPDAVFRYEDDQGRFSRATLRCVGVGECRKTKSGTMCPSYMATLEEQHSTRGRSRLLFEMLQGDVVKDGWKDKGIKESLDLCLSCKACVHECPVNVDMASYKAEFMAHHYRNRIRPLSAYLFGHIDKWLRLASRWPNTYSFLVKQSHSAKALKALAGIAQDRNMPQVANQSFTQWFQDRNAEPDNDGSQPKPQVILWPDTFNNFIRPQSAIAAFEVLKSLGFDVSVPLQPVCCGRPLYEFGMINQAEKHMESVISSIREPLRSGTPIVVLEPSCASVFKHDSPQLKSANEDYQRLKSQTYLFTEFLQKNAGNISKDAQDINAIVHGHCHQKSLFGMDTDLSILRDLGVNAELLETGCCGMAGAFGFEKDKFDISMKIGELSLLPKVRDTAKTTFIVADGFSCREQIEQSTDKKTVHTAELINLCRKQDVG